MVDGSYSPRPDSSNRLSLDGNVYTLKYKDATTLTFDANGNLSTWVAPSGVTATIAYVPATSLGRPGATDVFVTAADDIAGMNAAQIAERLTIPQSSTGFRVIEFPTPESGIASPVLRTDPGFVGGGRTAGGAREFVIPNQPIPPNATTRTVP